MFIFTHPAIWQGNKDIYQALVFSSEEMKKRYCDEMEKRRAEVYISNRNQPPEIRQRFVDETNDHNAGAIYKLKAIRKNDNWYGSIRCGFTGMLLWENPDCSAWPSDAFDTAKMHLLNEISNS